MIDNEDDALRELGVPPDATLQRKREAFVARATEANAAGNRDAYERAVEAARMVGAIGRAEMVPASESELASRRGRDLVERRDRLELERVANETNNLRRENAHRAIEEIACSQVNSLKHARRQRSLVSLLSALIGAIVFALRGIGSFHAISDNGDTLLVTGATTAVALGALTGLMAAGLAMRVQRLEQAFEDAETTLVRRVPLSRLLRILLPPSASSVSEDRLTSAVEEWCQEVPRETSSGIVSIDHDGRAQQQRNPRRQRRDLRRVARVMGACSFTEVLITTGKESGILVETERVDDGALVAEYEIRITPRDAGAADAAEVPDDDAQSASPA